ncbi:MAG: 23S rRNA (pseudouridine(1915)-N(3))-methyltransferase RlmH [Polymorphobacter sp.]|uniref:23S rRNA (pseudouridine(1915)-N(3))-methyltransferase RlmH n=1 Tax=Polymorphobacter sp. TaxID=1909290 RepID=UPI003A895536
MKLHIYARGRIGRSPEAELVARYTSRMRGLLTVTELSETAPFPPAPPGTRTIVLDERGQDLSSTTLAKTLEQWRDTGTRETRFLLGAADGHDEPTRAAADLLLAMGRTTWPHLLARAMLAEQLYRTHTILTGHPYHRD